MSADHYHGVPVVVAGTTYAMPPLSARIARQYWPRLQAFQAGDESDPLGLVGEVVLACLRRNYPDIDADAVLDAVDMDNLDSWLARAFGAGTWRQWVDKQRAAAGNAQPVEMATPGAGAAPTP